MTTILLTILVFGLIITLHELGHFFFAKLFGVRVNEFSFGMGPKLWSRQKGETVYSIRLLPIGGYVAMEGEDPSSEDEYALRDGRAFCDKKPWQRFLVLSAGAVMNLVLGFVILLFLSSQMELMGTNVVAKIASDAPVSQYVQPNDRIVKVNGHSTGSYNDVIFQMVRDADGIVDLEVRRGADPKAVFGRSKGEAVKLPQVPFVMTDAGEGRKTIQLDLTFYGAPNSFFGTIHYSVNWTISVVKQVWFSLVDIVSGRYGLNEISGPVGTAVVIEQASSYGLESFLLLFAFITINVGVFNLLPIPALDGGRLFFLLIEIAFKKPVPAKYEAYINATGMILLLGFVAVVTLNDIIKLIP
ncbi:MAG: site-2 protease family protein [Angelakisella sp.]